MGRLIGIRHRRKKTVEGESRPTQVAIVMNGKEVRHDLPDDQAELDFALGMFPIKYRGIDYATDSLSSFFARHVKWQVVKKGEAVPSVPEQFIQRRGQKTFVAVRVPASYEGLAQDDTVAMPLGGSGDMFAYAIVRRLEKIGGQVWRIPPFQLKAERGEANRDDDALLLTKLVVTKKYLFYPVQPRDEKIILLRELYRQRRDAQKARIACEQRLYQVVVGQVFIEMASEVAIEKHFEKAKANDPILQNMLALEAAADKRLVAAVEDLDVYRQVFNPLEGVGPQTSARIICGVVDVLRFSDRDKFVAFCGTSPDRNGRFRRYRRGQTCNWSPSVRQGLWLIISDQANKRPDSHWGQVLRDTKARLREKHPAVVVEGGKKRFTDGHIHKMATWKTATKLARYIYREWSLLERESRQRKAA